MIQLRPAQFSDHITIAKLHAASWQRTYRGIFSDHFLDHEVEQNRTKVWHDRLQSPAPNQRVTVAIQNDTIVGFACLFLDDDPVHGSLLDNLHVSFTLQKSGIGKLLMKNCARIIQEESNSSKMYLWVYEQNVNAIAAYERLNGKRFEVIEKENAEDGSKARICRYVWEDAATIG